MRKLKNKILIGTLCMANILSFNSYASSVSIKNTAFIQSLGGSATDTFSSGVENTLTKLLFFSRFNYLFLKLFIYIFALHLLLLY